MGVAPPCCYYWWLSPARSPSSCIRVNTLRWRPALCNSPFGLKAFVLICPASLCRHPWRSRGEMRELWVRPVWRRCRWRGGFDRHVFSDQSVLGRAATKAQHWPASPAATLSSLWPLWDISSSCRAPQSRSAWVFLAPWRWLSTHNSCSCHAGVPQGQVGGCQQR
jgi:hypothetical protein